MHALARAVGTQQTHEIRPQAIVIIRVRAETQHPGGIVQPGEVIIDAEYVELLLIRVPVGAQTLKHVRRIGYRGRQTMDLRIGEGHQFPVEYHELAIADRHGAPLWTFGTVSIEEVGYYVNNTFHNA